MDREIDRDVLLGFVTEAKEYLPVIRSSVEAYTLDTPPENLEEAHRLVHTIKGAASMIGLSELSQVAYRFESLLEELAAGPSPLPGPEPSEQLQQLLGQLEVALQDAEEERESAPASPQEERGRLDSLEDPFPMETYPPEEFSSELPFQEEGSPTFPMDLCPTPGDLGDEWALFGDPPPLVEPPGTPSHQDDLESFSLESMFQEVKPSPERETPSLSADQGDVVSPELLEVFQLEAEEHLRTITATLPLLEQNPENKGYLQAIRRSAHTLKGAAGMVGFAKVTQLAHRMEDALDLLYEDGLALTPQVLRLLYDSTDGLEDLAAGRSVDLESILQRYSSDLTATAAETQVAADPASVLAEVVEEPVATEEPAQEAPREVGETASPSAQKRARVGDSLDEVVKLVSEQVIARTVFEQRMADFQRLLNELQPSTERLRRVSYKIETQYEATALGEGGGGGPGKFPNRLLKSLQPYGFDDLEFDRYSEFHLLSRELSETTSDIQTLAVELSHLQGDFDSYLTQQAQLTSAIEDKMMRMRMVPLATLASRLHRTVRQVAQQQGKKCTLTLEGENTGLDRNVLEEMSEPLMHLLRNAVDHGIEPAERRQSLGKAPHGQIRFRASHEGSQVVLRISDDGSGLDLEAIRKTAIQRGLVSAAESSHLSEREILSFIFQPGFSTAQKVSEISGRGVGLDIVAARVNQLKGVFNVESQPGKGTTFTIRLPMTLAITRALMVKAHNETFAFPLDDIRQILRIDRKEIESIGQGSMLRIGGRAYPVLHLARELGLRQPGEELVQHPPVLILDTGDREVALVVDDLLGAREIVVKNLGNHLKRVRGVSGATLLGDGSVVLILNSLELVQDRKVSTVCRASLPAARATHSDSDWTILIVDDSPSVRRVVSGQIKQAGWKPVTAKNGLEALELLQHGDLDPDLVLLDVEMPRMDGYEFLATLRANEALRDLPVVMLTSRAGDKHRKKAFDLGVSDYLIKPYENEVLLARIQRLVANSRQTVQ